MKTETSIAEYNKIPNLYKIKSTSIIIYNIKSKTGLTRLMLQPPWRRTLTLSVQIFGHRLQNRGESLLYFLPPDTIEAPYFSAPSQKTIFVQSPTSAKGQPVTAQYLHQHPSRPPLTECVSDKMYEKSAEPQAFQTCCIKNICLRFHIKMFCLDWWVCIYLPPCFRFFLSS